MRVSVSMQRTASTTLSVGSVSNAAVNMRRFKAYDIICGSEATPADFAFLWQVTRRTTLPTGTSVTPVVLDQNDTIASTLVGLQNNLTTGTSGGVLLSIPLNQRATFRWVAAPGSELVTSAAASQGISVDTPTAGSLVAVTATVLCDEQ